MTLEGNFYNIKSLTKTENGFDGVVELVHDHPIYAGHFPEQAVVPGVCTLAIVRECVERVLGVRGEFVAIKECKYVSVVLPCKELTLRLSFEQSEDGALKGTVEECAKQQTVLKLKATFQKR